MIAGKKKMRQGTKERTLTVKKICLFRISCPSSETTIATEAGTCSVAGRKLFLLRVCSHRQKLGYRRKKLGKIISEMEPPYQTKRRQLFLLPTTFSSKDDVVVQRPTKNGSGSLRLLVISSPSKPPGWLPVGVCGAFQSQTLLSLPFRLEPSK